MLISVTEEDRERVNQAVAAAESRTSAEIVPVLAAASGRYDRSEDIVGLWAGVIALLLTWWLLPPAQTASGDWSGMPDWLRPVLLALSVVLGFVVGAMLASRIDGLRGLFTPARQQRDEVLARAREAFFDARVHHTTAATGLLIYVSLFERRAAVLADATVLETVGQQVLDELRDRLVNVLREQSPVAALCSVIEAAGERLAAALPRQAGDVNELPNALVLLERP